MHRSIVCWPGKGLRGEGRGVMNLSGASSFNLSVANQGTSKRDNPPLSVPKDRNRRKIAAFSNRQVQESQLYCRNRRKSPENRRKIAAISWGAEQKSQRFPRLQNSQRFQDAKIPLPLSVLT